ncbi:MAG: endonuclease MutS2 [Pelovirga sp.]
MTDAVLQERLGFPQLRLWLAGQTQAEPGRLLAEQLQPLEDQAAVETALTETDEALELVRASQVPALGGCHDLTPVVTQCQPIGCLVPATELRLVLASLQATEACRVWFKQHAGQPRLAALGSAIVPLAELQRRLRDAIGERGELLDSASAGLAAIRYELRQTRARIKQQLERLLADDRLAFCFQERLVTIRNGRYVVPLKSDCRGQLKGFVQDESASGQTLYLEPAQALEGNNRLQQLLREEQREERRILLQLADLVRRDQQQLLNNQRLLGRIDLRFAAARLSQAYQGCRPELVSASLVALKEVRHPLLMAKEQGFDRDAATPIDLLIPQEAQALVISGPNTGGKSVALKTLGLMLLMLRAGLHLPCHPDSRIHLYRRLFVDIGDDQSIADSLSTFSGHLRRIREILAVADSDTLVLLDEAGSGTDPAEGAALIQAVVEQLCAQGAKVLLTTHLGQLKHFAHIRDGIVNAAVEFDPQTLEPTYGLVYGIPGSSSALSTARRLGLPEKVVQQAVAYLGNEHDQNQLLIALNRQKLQLDEEQRELRRLRLEAEATQQLRRRQLEQLKQSKQEILARAGRQAEELIKATEERIKQLRKSGAGTPTPAAATEQRRQLDEARRLLVPFAPAPRRSQEVPRQLQVGELVRVVPLDVEARVERLLPTEVEVQVGGKRMRLPLTALEQFSPRRFAGAQAQAAGVIRPSSGRQLTPQLKLVGQRVDDALQLLERYLDDALLHHLDQVEIIHGAGQGVLRRAVRDYLAKAPGVSAFYAAAVDQGGDNVTIAELGGR